MKGSLSPKYSVFFKLYFALGLMFFVIFIGTSGYMMVEEWTFLESLYMTIITVSTVGFQEVRPLSDFGRLFTAILIISSLGVFGFAITSITTYIVSGEMKDYFLKYKGMSKVAKLENHVVICGYGRVGQKAVEVLLFHKKKFVIIEKSSKIIEENQDNKDLLFLEGEATMDDVLSKSGIEKASSMIIALPNDADNLFVVVSARELNKRIKIISRASNPSTVKKLKIAGADNVIMPDTVGGSHMASLVLTPDVMEFLDMIRVDGVGESNLEEVSFDSLQENFKFNTIGDLNAYDITGCKIVGYKSVLGEYIINPSKETKVEKGSKLFALGNTVQINNLKELINQ